MPAVTEVECVVDTEILPGMGAILTDHGTGFRVWAPNAEAVSVVGTFNDWNDAENPLYAEDGGYWYGFVANAHAADEYRYIIRNGEQVLSRIDPYAQELTTSVGNCLITDPDFDWQGDDFILPPRESLVIYEMHVGTFGRSHRAGDQVADFHTAVARLDYLQRMGINCIELMPVAEFAGDVSWGYNPAQPFSVESAYGGPDALKTLIREAHRRGIGVILDVVYNHFGPGDLSLWQFDGWSENGMGGIYFYNDWRAATPWGETRPDYGRPEVRQYIRDNALMWIQDYHIDGLRFDMTLFIRHVRGDGDPGAELPDGWSLAQWINEEIQRVKPNAITIAEDLQNNDWLTKSPGEGGAGFRMQWDAGFVHPVREALISMDDAHRSMASLRAALEHAYNGDAFQRVIYTESHDEVANGKARVPAEIDPSNGSDWFARKRSTLGAVLVFTTPGIPMLFQGQEFLQDGWFQDTLPLDWNRTKEHRGILRLYTDLIELRTNAAGATRALQGIGLEIVHHDEDAKTLAFRRWHTDESTEHILVAFNFSHEPRTLPVELAAGTWKPIFNSDAKIYAQDFMNTPTQEIDATQDQGHHLSIGPYSAVMYRLAPSPT